MEPNLNDLHVSTQPPFLIHNNGLLSPESDRANRHLSSSSAAASTSPTKKKRGRPRKYATPEQALAVRKAAASSPSAKGRKERTATLLQQLTKQGVVGNSDSGDGERGYLSKKSMTWSNSSGNAGHGFVPHVIAVAAGDDVTQRVMEFTQQSKCEICVLSASGSIYTAYLRQPATKGGTITYGGWFEIITLSGSYIRTHLGGRTGGLSICLSSPDGMLIGGGVRGPLTVAGPVEVIIESFIFDTKKDYSNAITDKSPSKSSTPIPSVDASHFLVHPGTHVTNSWLED